MELKIILKLFFIILSTACSYIPETNYQTRSNDVVVCKNYGKYNDCVISDRDSASFELQRVLDRY